MNEVISKLSSYNLFNNLLPGIIFSAMIEQFTHYSLIQDNLLIGVFLYYFIGLILSRVGSIVIEPFLKWIKFLKFAEYKDFVEASKKDGKIEIFSEQNNMYRTFIAMLLLFLILRAYEVLSLIYPIFESLGEYILLFSILLLFLISYKKQTSYIRKRVTINK